MSPQPIHSVHRAHGVFSCAMHRAMQGNGRSIVVAGLVAAVFSWSSPAMARVPGIVASHDCLQCHQVDPARSSALTTLGPAFRQVAQRYRKDKTAEDKLVKKILKGGNGQWGTNNMPPQAVSEEETRAIVRWILKLK